MRVLIAEDDEMARMLLETALIGWGYDVVLASNGDEALEAIQGKSPIHFAMLDCPPFLSLCLKSWVELHYMV
jgi:CheY-like chemotaxis protein